MFQHFDELSQKSASAARLALLRAELARRGLDAFLVPRSDEYQGEYVAPYAERLSWLSGFSGSAGLAIVLAERAAIFVDGRYTVQVREQVDERLFEPHDVTDEPPYQWLAGVLAEGARVGFDPWLVTADQAHKFRTACATRGRQPRGRSPKTPSMPCGPSSRPGPPTRLQPNRCSSPAAVPPTSWATSPPASPSRAPGRLS